MNRRTLFLPAAALSAAVLLAACGGTSATTAPTNTAATGPTSGATSGATPAAPAATANTPASTPVPGTTAAAPSFASDTVLASRFPTTIDGQPVTNVQTALYVDFVRQFSTSPDEIQRATALFSSIGLDFTRMSFGSATATVDGESVGLIALRTPDTDANKIIQNYALISGALDASPPPAPTMSQSSIGGKNVTVAVDSEGKTTVLYVTGDTLFLVQNTTDSQTTKILQALP